MLAHGRQTVPERGVVRSRKPFKFWWAPTISLERLIVSGAVHLSGRSVWQTGDRHRSQFITLTVDICVRYNGRKALLRAGLSAAAETCTKILILSLQTKSLTKSTAKIAIYHEQLNQLSCNSLESCKRNS